MTSCYTAGDGSAPPTKSFYFPTGLTVSRGGNVLYAINSDFDLQFNGGTLQSYDLHQIRRRAVENIREAQARGCPGQLPDRGGLRQNLGDICAPPTDSTVFVRDSAIVGAFATDLQLSPDKSRIYAPIRGDASVTWADVVPDDATVAPAANDGPEQYAPFRLDCGARAAGRCDVAHHAGSDPDEPGNTRRLSMPGEPFGMAQSEDGTAIVITHQTEDKASLLTTGFRPDGTKAGTPALQFVLDKVAVGGNGVVAIPHDPEAYDASHPAPRPAFLQTSRRAPELTLMRYFSDEGFTVDDQGRSALLRPFLVKERVFAITANAGGQDSRGIAVDPSPRIRCKAQVAAANPDAGRTDEQVRAERVACARLSARLYFANRSPASLLVGELGDSAAARDGSYDADTVSIFANLPLAAGASRVHVAPIVDARGRYALRVFIISYDTASVFVYDPDANAIENVIRVAAGPFAITFDPFNLEDAALGREVPRDTRDPDLDLRRYRFAYVASFTNSFVQVLDLDGSREDKSTFETVVYTLGSPTIPKGSQ